MRFSWNVNLHRLRNKFNFPISKRWRKVLSRLQPLRNSSNNSGFGRGYEDICERSRLMTSTIIYDWNIKTNVRLMSNDGSLFRWQFVRRWKKRWSKIYQFLVSCSMLFLLKLPSSFFCQRIFSKSLVYFSNFSFQNVQILPHNLTHSAQLISDSSFNIHFRLQSSNVYRWLPFSINDRKFDLSTRMFFCFFLSTAIFIKFFFVRRHVSFFLLKITVIIRIVGRWRGELFSISDTDLADYRRFVCV